MKWLKVISKRGFIWVITLWQALWVKPMPSKVKNKWISWAPFASITIIPDVNSSIFKLKHLGYSFFQFLEWHTVSPLADFNKTSWDSEHHFFFLFSRFPYKEGNIPPASFKSIPRQQGDLHTNRLANLHPVWLGQQD